MNINQEEFRKILDITARKNKTSFTSNDVDTIIKALNQIKPDEYIYEFLYCNCIHESAYATVSLHHTQKGAEMALEFHKNERFKEWEDFNKKCLESDPEFYSKFPNKFAEYEGWYIQQTKILE